MRAASVIARPEKMKTNSAANRIPANTPGQNVPSRSQNGMPRYPPQASSSAAATSERSPDWKMSEMPCAVNLAATWPTPQMRHSSTIIETAVASSALRSALTPDVPCSASTGAEVVVLDQVVGLEVGHAVALEHDLAVHDDVA